MKASYGQKQLKIYAIQFPLSSSIMQTISFMMIICCQKSHDGLINPKASSN